MRSIILLAVGLYLAYPAVAQAGPSEYSLRQECTRDRCVYYHGSTREFSVEKEHDTDRLVVRNGERDVVAKIRRQDDGTLRVKETSRRR